MASPNARLADDAKRLGHAHSRPGLSERGSLFVFAHHRYLSPSLIASHGNLHPGRRPMPTASVG